MKPLACCTAIFVLLFSCANAFAHPQNPDFITFINRRFSVDNGKSAGRAGGFRCAFDSDQLAARVLAEYGAMFAASDIVTLPATCIFPTSEAVAAYQKDVKASAVDVGGSRVELQVSAAASLSKAASEAVEAGVGLSPFDPPVAARRNYNDSVRIWNRRLIPALDFWESSGIIPPDESIAIRNMPFVEQARRVIEWESRGYKFGTGRLRSIFSSCSPPGTSQHLALVAFDVLQYSDSRVRRILNSNNWYQTVIDDPGHFTYLGVPETELPARGLRLVPAGGYAYWVPDIRKPPMQPSPQPVVTLTSD